MDRRSSLEQLASLIYASTSLPETFYPSDSVILRTEFVEALMEWLRARGWEFDREDFFSRCIDDATPIR